METRDFLAPQAHEVSQEPLVGQEYLVSLVDQGQMVNLAALDLSGHEAVVVRVPLLHTTKPYTRETIQRTITPTSFVGLSHMNELKYFFSGFWKELDWHLPGKCTEDSYSELGSRKI